MAANKSKPQLSTVPPTQEILSKKSIRWWMVGAVAVVLSFEICKGYPSFDLHWTRQAVGRLVHSFLGP
jgi:hypothetical protein